MEPQFAFILEDAGQAVGYVLGTADTAGFVQRYTESWVPYLRQRYPQPHAESDRFLLELGLNPERMLAEGLAAYPAHLHIDLLPQAQGQGFGRQLIHRFLQTVRAAGAPAVHLGVAESNTGAIAFYQRLGFERLPVDGIHLGRSTEVTS
nr:GNAT family N-acetyltransferase [Kineosporia babensis]